MEHRYPNDTWSLADDLGLGGVGDQVARTLLEAQPPFTLGVTGKWGAGKTSVLRRAFATLGGRPLEQALLLRKRGSEQDDDDDWKRLSADDRWIALGWGDDYRTWMSQSICVWFSPWQHQADANPLVPLLREIQTQFESRLTGGKRTVRELGKRKRSLGLAALNLMEHAVDAAVSLTVAQPKSFSLARGASEAVRQGWKEGEEKLTAISDGQRFHLLFEDAVEELLQAIAGTRGTPNEHARLIIFVDDLDRCEESVIVQLLEAIKLYLGSRRCVFVLGLDHGAVMDALERYWKRSEDANREYLEKLFQGTVAVPLPRPRGVTDSVRSQLKRHGIPARADDIDALRLQMATDIERLIEPNPRKLKNFVNSLCAGWSLHGASVWADGEEARRFVLYQYLRAYHPRIWRLLERQPVTLMVLWYVLHGQSVALESADLRGLDRDDQRLLEQAFSRAFSHVLADRRDPNSDPDPGRHRAQDLDQALAAFEHRQDRKRSDETFVAAFKELHSQGAEPLRDEYLYAAEPTSTGAREASS